MQRSEHPRRLQLVKPAGCEEMDTVEYPAKSVIGITRSSGVQHQQYALLHDFFGFMKYIAKKTIGTVFSGIKTVSHRKKVSVITIINLKYHFFVLALAVFSSGCATIDSNSVRDGGRQVQENIEISEDYSVDSEIRDEFEKAVSLMKSEHYAEAIRLLRAVTAKAKRFTSPYINLAIAYGKTDDLGQAEENLKKALKLNELHPVANNELALVYRRTGRFKEARTTYEKVLAKYPAFLPARKNLGVLCDIYLQDLNCALQQYEFYLGYLPDDEQVKIWAADVKNRM